MTRKSFSTSSSQTPTKNKKLIVGKTFKVSVKKQIQLKLFSYFSQGAQEKSRPILVANETQLIHLCDRFSECSEHRASTRKRKGKENNERNYTIILCGFNTSR